MKLVNTIHEVSDHEQILKIANRILAKDGQIFIIIPNNKSIHRLIGIDMDLLASQDALTKTEITMQQKRNFSPLSISQSLIAAGFAIDEIFTSFVKPLTHLQMQTGVDNGEITEELLDSLYQLSPLFDPYASEIFAVGRKL